jgi:signal transduction histidine kinase
VLPKFLKKLSFQFGFVFAVLTVTPLVLTAVNLIGVNRTGIENATMELYSNTAEMAAREVDFFIKSKQELTKRFSTSVDTSAESVAYGTVADLEDLFKHDGSLIKITLYDDNGRRVVELVKGSTEVPKLGSLSSHEAFDEAFEGRASNYFLKSDRGLYFFNYTPLLNGWVLTTVNEAEELTRALDQHRFGRSGAVCLIDDKGRGIYRPDFDELPGDVAGYSNSEQIGEFQERRVYGTSECYINDGRRVLVAFAPTAEYKGGIIVHQLYDDAYYSSIKLLKNSIVGVVLGTALAVSVAVLFSIYLTRPMRRLADASRQIARGDYRTRVKSKRSDEMGELIDTFNDMVNSIEEKEDFARSNVELEQFAYVASHELKEPLRMITSYLHFLEEDCKGRLGEDADESIGFAVDGASRMRQLIDDLLEYSRVGTGRKEFEPVDCESVIDTALVDLEPVVTEKEAVITLDDLPVVMGNYIELEQLFKNLIGNALKFKSEEPPRISISATRKENQWVFAVKDNGIGIDMDNSQRLFLLFQRLHGIEEYPGTGIGLAICKKIIEGHGGVIWVESEIGRGSTFYFTLPVKEDIESDYRGEEAQS